MNVDIITREHPDRDLCTARIAAVYRRAYGARLESFMPLILRVAEDEGSLRAVLGVRSAGEDKLYLESYLDAPIARIVSEKTGEVVQRADIAEIGNLAESRPGDARLGIIAATMYLHTLGYRWAALTVVPQLVNSFKRLGIELCEIQPADPMRLPEEQRSVWGRYYEEKPMVCYASVVAGYTNLCEFEATWLGARRLAERELQSWEHRSI